MIAHCRFLELDSKSSGETFGHTSDYKSNDGLFSVWFLNRKLFPLSACRHAVCGSVGLFRISDRKKKRSSIHLDQVYMLLQCSHHIWNNMLSGQNGGTNSPFWGVTWYMPFLSNTMLQVKEPNVYFFSLNSLSNHLLICFQSVPCGLLMMMLFLAKACGVF